VLTITVATKKKRFNIDCISASVIQEQQSQIEQLQSENESLKERIEALLIILRRWKI